MTPGTSGGDAASDVTGGGGDTAEPDIADDNVFEGNTQNVMTDGDLEVPSESMAVPELKDFN